MYYPKSQITTGLKTTDGSFITSKGMVYKGEYFITSDGKYFAGSNPLGNGTFQIYPTQPLTELNDRSEPYSDIISIINPDYYQSRNIEDITSEGIKQPISHYPKPSSKDYELGEIIRFFLKKRNEIQYKEINKQTFIDYQNQNPNCFYQLYKPFSIPWVISGNKDDVYNINKKTTFNIIRSLNLIGFNLFLRDNYTQFYKD